MTYEEFKIAMTEAVTNLVGEEVKVSLHRISKNNGVILDAITVMEGDQNMAPTIYLKDYYFRYRRGSRIEELAEELLDYTRKNSRRGKVPEHYFTDFSQVKKRICFKLVNYEKNKDLLATVPHRKMMDLAMVFYFSMDPAVMERATALIRDEDMERWGTNEAEIRRLAMENTPRMLKWRLATVSELLQDMLDLEIEGECCSPFMIGLEETNPFPMHVLTNEEKYFGAACMFYPGLLRQISEKFNDNLYVLPSSIHECIIVPASGNHTRKSLSELVTEINEIQVEETEFLADNAYFYNRETRTLSTWEPEDMQYMDQGNEANIQVVLNC